MGSCLHWKCFVLRYCSPAALHSVQICTVARVHCCRREAHRYCKPFTYLAARIVAKRLPSQRPCSSPVSAMPIGAVYKRNKKRASTEGLVSDGRADSKEDNLHSATESEVLVQQNETAKPKGRPRIQHSAHAQATATQLACQHRPNCRPNLSSEADYFADLDTEQLIEDCMPGDCQQKTQATQQDTSGMVQQSASLQHADCTSAQTGSDTHAALQTPDAVWLTAHHPALQAKYMEYVQCMGDKLTPMPLEAFCKVLGRAERGTPVLNT